MDWQSSMGMYHFQQQPPDEEVEDDNEDFYGENEEAKAGAAAEADGDAGDLLSSLLPKEPEAAAQVQVQVQQAPTPKPAPATLSVAERKAENQRKADLLRAQLLAKRQNTPLKPATPQPGTPAKAPMVPQQPAITPAQPKPVPEVKHDVFHFGSDGLVVPAEVGKPSNGTLNLDSLIAEGKRLAEAKAKEQSNAQSNGHADEPTPAPVNHVKPTTAPKPAETPKAPAQRAPVQVHQAPATAEKAQPSQFLTDVYYADLAAWLEHTGYHDVEYRAAKLQKHKARMALEAEAAKIQEQLDQLKREEEAEMQALRSSIAHPSATPQTAPSLPPTMPSGDAGILATVAQGLTNSTKRPHSPTPGERSNNKRREEASTNGFRIRGANDSPLSPHALERRISYPDVRRRSLDAAKSRDPSLERRQAYYKRDGERAGAPRAYDAYEPGRDGKLFPSSSREYNGGRGGAGYWGRGGGGGGGGGGGHGREYNHSYRGSGVQSGGSTRRDAR